MSVLVSYQNKAVEEACIRITKLLNSEASPSPARFLLQAPTGSGKTVMLAEIMNCISSEPEQDIAYIFLAPNSLHTQAKNSFNYYLNSGTLTLITELPMGRTLDRNSVLFLNWSSINRETSTKIKENETGQYLSNIIKLTRQASRKIVVIIDESHNTAGSAKSKELIEIISPCVIIEATATPSWQPTVKEAQEGKADGWIVSRDEVVAENMICKGAVFNHSLQEYEETLRNENHGQAVEPDELFIYAALKERKRFQQALQEEGRIYNPLMGIQLPPENNANNDTAKELQQVDSVIEYLMKLGVERNKIAVYLSTRRENMEDISNNNSDIEVIIFKSAIAIGWDCPRLKTGALLRDIKTKPFAIQSLGRWLRQPEQKSYVNPYLNYPRLYTEYELMPNVSNKNDTEISLSQKVTIRPYFTNMIDRMQLPSWYSVGINEALLPMDFFAANFGDGLVKAYSGIHLFSRVSNPIDVLRKLGTDTINPHLNISTEIVRVLLVNDIDTGDVEQTGEVVRLSTAREIHNRFDAFVANAVETYNIKNSKIIADDILSLISHRFNLTNSSVAGFILSNTEFKRVIERAVISVMNKYAIEFPDALIRESEYETRMWSPPETIEMKYKDVSDVILTSDENTYIYDYLPILKKNNGKVWETERAYLNLIESPEYKRKYRMVLKNGDNGALNFAIPYTEPVAEGSSQNVTRLFYPDWIVVRHDGRIEIHETKSGGYLTNANTLAKWNALKAYCIEMRKRGIRVSGGIVNVENAHTDYPTFTISGERATTLARHGPGTEWLLLA